MIKNANELQEFINSVRKKAFEDVVKLIQSDAVRKDVNGFIMIYDDDLIELIQGLDTAKIKKEEAEAEIDNIA
jgi:hypothetical protein